MLKVRRDLRLRDRVILDVPLNGVLMDANDSSSHANPDVGEESSLTEQVDCLAADLQEFSGLLHGVHLNSPILMRPSVTSSFPSGAAE